MTKRDQTVFDTVMTDDGNLTPLINTGRVYLGFQIQTATLLGAISFRNLANLPGRRVGIPTKWEDFRTFIGTVSVLPTPSLVRPQ